MHVDISTVFPVEPRMPAYLHVLNILCVSLQPHASKMHEYFSVVYVFYTTSFYQPIWLEFPTTNTGSNYMYIGAPPPTVTPPHYFLLTCLNRMSPVKSQLVIPMTSCRSVIPDEMRQVHSVALASPTFSHSVDCSLCAVTSRLLIILVSLNT